MKFEAKITYDKNPKQMICLATAYHFEVLEYSEIQLKKLRI
jgi:hypothetical protein